MSAQSFNIALSNIYLLGNLFDSITVANNELKSTKQGIINSTTCQSLLVNTSKSPIVPRINNMFLFILFYC